MKIGKKVKIILSIILMIGVMFAQNLNVKAVPNSVTRKSSGDYTGSLYYFPLQVDSVSDEVIYCTQIHNRSYSTGDICEKSDSWNTKTAAGVAAIIKAVGSNTSTTSMTAQYYAATLAINKFLCNLDSTCTGSSHPNWVLDTGSLYLYNASDDALYRSYLAAAETAYSKDYSSASASISPRSLTFTLSGDNYVSNEFTISGNGYGSPSVTINGTNINNRLSSTGVSSYKITIPKSSLSDGDNTVRVSVTASKSYDIAVNYTCGGNQNVTYGKLDSKNSSDSDNISGTITVERKKKVQILKVDQAGNALAGATLRLKNSSGGQVYEWTSETTPQEFTTLEIGQKYTVEEVAAPAGYEKGESVTFTVDDNTSEIQLVKVTNKRVYKVQILKVDQAGNALAGAKLRLKDSSGTAIAEWTSEATAKEFTTLLAGQKYTVEEVEAPAGYTKITPVTFTVDGSLTVAQVVRVTNKKDVAKKVIVYKRDNNNNLLGGAVLELYDADNKVVVENWKTQNVNPKTFENLRIGGHYQIREVAAPEGYVLSKTPLEFTVTKVEGSETSIELNVPNKPNKIQIIKIDASTNKPLAGVKLQIQDEKGNVVKGKDSKDLVWTTDGKPYVIQELAAGKYYVKEIETINGYILNTELKEFVVKDTDENITVKFENKPTEVKISKLSESNKKPLIGAHLQVQDEKGNVVEEWDTDGTIHEIIGLEYGVYYLVETKAPEGYELSKEKIKFEVTKDIIENPIELTNALIVDVPNTLSARSTLLLCIAMFDIALGIGIVTYVKKNKVQE